MSDRIVLGSGYLYVAEFSGTIPDDATLEVTANRLGYIKGGATSQAAPGRPRSPSTTWARSPRSSPPRRTSR